MDFKIGDKVCKHNDTKEYTISAVHDYGYKELNGAVSIWMIDKDLNNYTSNSNKIYIKRNILKKVLHFTMTIVAFFSPKRKTVNKIKNEINPS